MISVAEPKLLGREKEYVLDCLNKNQLSGGEYVQRFEEAFAKFCGTKYAISCSSGTSALHLALLGLGLSPLAEVIVPALTFVATANAVRYCGATPVFVEIDPRTWCIDPSSVDRAVTARTVGVIPVHLYGVPTQMDVLAKVAEKHKLWIVEDAAEAHGAVLDGLKVGSMGNAGVFSFYGNKIITCGEGGMVTTSDEDLAKKIRLYRGQGMSANRRYYHEVVGYNYRMTNLQAALGLAQLERIDAHLAYRERLFEIYREELKGRFTLQAEPRNGSKSANWMFTFLADSQEQRDKIMESLQIAEVETRPVFIPLTELPMYRGITPMNSADIAARGISLPTHAGITPAQARMIVRSIREIIEYDYRTRAS